MKLGKLSMGLVGLMICAALLTNYPLADYVRYGAPGTIDFIEYYAAFQVAWAGLNPYDPILMFEAQRSLGISGNSPTMMFNPPWTLLILAPLLALPFPLAALLFLILKAALYVGLVALLWSVSSSRPVKLIDLIPILLFLPVMNDLVMGQTAVLPTLGVGMFLVLRRWKRPFLAGLSLALCAIKPHVVYLLAAPLLLEFQHREGRAVWRGIIAAVSALVLLTSLLFPQAVVAWVAAVADEGGIIREHTRRFKTATFVSAFRSYLPSAYQALPGPDLALYLLPVVTLLMTLFVLTLFFRRGRYSSSVYGMLCTFSIMTTAYGWIFDQSVLVIPITIALASVSDCDRPRLRALLCFASVVGFCEYALLDRPHSLFWYPALYMVLLWRPLRGAPNAPSPT